MASTGVKHEARNGGRNGKTPRVEEPKNKIKKLTADKIRENLALISRKNGEIDLTSHGIESIISLDGLQHATKLMLSHNKLTKLSDLKRVQNITMLKLIDNKLNGEVRSLVSSRVLWFVHVELSLLTWYDMIECVCTGPG